MRHTENKSRRKTRIPHYSKCQNKGSAIRGPMRCQNVNSVKATGVWYRRIPQETKACTLFPVRAATHSIRNCEHTLPSPLTETLDTATVEILSSTKHSRQGSKIVNHSVPTLTHPCVQTDTATLLGGRDPTLCNHEPHLLVLDTTEFTSLCYREPSR